jgi:hypothetical protein
VLKIAVELKIDQEELVAKSIENSFFNVKESTNLKKEDPVEI